MLTASRSREHADEVAGAWFLSLVLSEAASPNRNSPLVFPIGYVQVSLTIKRILVLNFFNKGV